jgi:hypothetical protein
MARSPSPEAPRGLQAASWHLQDSRWKFQWPNHLTQTPTRLRYGSRIAIRKHAFSQKTLDEIVDVFAAKRRPDFGYKYIQLDDAFRTGNGSCPQNWLTLTWNPKFPGGPEYALQKIKSAVMEGGI